ncbi:hypothetical protein CJ030_MR5G024792 [Morella rubra]|uniref:Uncharacterized protein n=1 Tax=Morella rubra TaxID=262757 RepID=A0A6A1VMR9_9ROSI|nr:hypothetical protein CJ030_MR5G024792 [Morella rubra]
MASVIASVSKQLDHVNKALAESSIAWPLCRNQEASSLEAGELRLEGGGAQGNNQAHCKIMYKAILLFLAKYAFYLNNKQEVNEVKSNLSQIGFDVASIHQMLSGLEGKVELLESKQEKPLQASSHLKSTRRNPYNNDLDTGNLSCLTLTTLM